MDCIYQGGKSDGMRFTASDDTKEVQRGDDTYAITKRKAEKRVVFALVKPSKE